MCRAGGGFRADTSGSGALDGQLRRLPHYRRALANGEPAAARLWRSHDRHRALRARRHTACPAATDQGRGRMTWPGSSEKSDARHRCRQPVSGHGTAFLKARTEHPRNRGSIGRDEAVGNGEPLQTVHP